jgi:hypothetical protein
MQNTVRAPGHVHPSDLSGALVGVLRFGVCRPTAAGVEPFRPRGGAGGPPHARDDAGEASNRSLPERENALEVDVRGPGASGRSEHGKGREPSFFALPLVVMAALGVACTAAMVALLGMA